MTNNQIRTNFCPQCKERADRMEERAAIVAWLRKEAIMSTDTVRRRMNKALDQIEAGDHLK